MHAIFQRAGVTLVAAVNTFNGLAGESTHGDPKDPGRTVQQEVQTGDVKLVAGSEPKHAIEDSIWSQRG